MWGEEGRAVVSEEIPSRDVLVAWIGAEDLPVLFVNQFVGQVHEDTFFLTAGQMIPPALVGTPEERAEQLEQIAYVPVKPVARLALTRADIQQLVSTLNANLDQHEEIRRSRGGEGA